jgi:predicted AlkP superfamily pyrophosphatase or phosphodiesterase
MRHEYVFLIQILRMRVILFFCVILLGMPLLAQSEKAPKLVVGIVVDQMCYDYLYRFDQKFSKTGFKKLMQKGTNCRNTRYNYVPTFTGPGHASIYTGTTPSNHGIVANDWYDRATGAIFNCVDDASVFTVGSTNDEGKCSPHHLKTTTVTDQLKMTYPEAKVISVSIKDRGAILPGGHLSDGSYWFDSYSGKFITSSFFEKELPEWVAKFNEEKRPQKALNSVWNTLYDVTSYSESGPDNSQYEQVFPGKDSPVFPYDLNKMKEGSQDFSLFTYTPYANTALTDLAINGIQSEGLGTDRRTDMLCISYSTPDLIGHAFGPYSVELEDIYLRLDQDLSRLISFLEKQVGKHEFVIMLMADHAVVPVPQQLVDKKLPGGYFFSSNYMTELRQKLVQQFQIDPIKELVNCNIYLDEELIKKNKKDQHLIEQFIVNEVRQWKEVKAVYSGTELSGDQEGDNWFKMIQSGYHREESGDILFVLESGYLIKSADVPTAHQGTSHGSAFNYDTHVPLIWYGKGIPAREVLRRVDITDIAATLTNMLFLQRTGSMTGEPIVELRK